MRESGLADFLLTASPPLRETVYVGIQRQRYGDGPVFRGVRRPEDTIIVKGPGLVDFALLPHLRDHRKVLPPG